MDSTPFDVRVVLDDGTVDRAELTLMIDVATRSIPSSRVASDDEGGGRVAAAGPMRDAGADASGWPDALRMSRSVLPFDRLLEIDARLGMQRPVR